MIAILYTRHSDMEQFVIGPFLDDAAAAAWAASDAEAKAGDERHRIDGDGKEYLSILDDNGGADHEWLVVPMIPANSLELP